VSMFMIIILFIACMWY